VPCHVLHGQLENTESGFDNFDRRNFFPLDFMERSTRDYIQGYTLLILAPMTVKWQTFNTAAVKHDESIARWKMKDKPRYRRAMENKYDKGRKLWQGSIFKPKKRDQLTNKGNLCPSYHGVWWQPNKHIIKNRNSRRHQSESIRMFYVMGTTKRYVIGIWVIQQFKARKGEIQFGVRSCMTTKLHDRKKPYPVWYNSLANSIKQWKLNGAEPVYVSKDYFTQCRVLAPPFRLVPCYRRKPLKVTSVGDWGMPDWPNIWMREAYGPKFVYEVCKS